MTTEEPSARIGSALSSLPSNGRVIAAPVRGGDAAVMTLLGGRQYEMVYHPQCKVCNSQQHRNAIENALLVSYSYKKIAESLPEDANISWRNISEHYNRGHMPLDEAVHRAIIEDRAREMSLDIDGYESTLADHITFARLGLHKGLQKMMRGEFEPNLDQTIALANFLLKVEQVGGGTDFDMELVMGGFFAYMDSIEAVCTPEQVAQITQLIQAHPVLRALAHSSRARQEDDDDDYEQLPASTE